MITAEQIRDILSLYAKHGWLLKQVLITNKLKNSLNDSVENMFSPAEIVESKIDAVWFSRASGDKEAWELRRLSETPYALFEMFEAEDEEEVREEIRREMEARLI